MAAPVIQTENLSKVFGRGPSQKLAVNQLNLNIAPGQVYGFLGVNGAGKTTTIRMLLTLMRPSAGKALIFGEDPRTNPSILKRVGALVEGATFYPFLSGLDNLRVVGNSTSGFDAAVADRLLTQVGLAEAKNKRFRTYSTGMKQRLGIAAALLHNPELIVLDEPTSGMDPAGIRSMRQFIRSLAHQQGKTVFLTSHLLAEVQQICDRLAIINNGTLIREGRLDALLTAQWLVVEVGDVDAAVDTLNEQWVCERTPIDGQIHINAKREATPTIVKQLVAADIEIFSIYPHQQSLEDYFLHEVGGTTQP